MPKDVVTIPWLENYQLLEAVDSWSHSIRPSPFARKNDEKKNEGKPLVADEVVTPAIARSKAYEMDAPEDEEIPKYSTDVLGSNGSVRYFYTVVTDSKEFSDALGVVASLSGSYGGFSGSLAGELARNSNMKLFHTHAYAGVFTRDYVVQVPLVYLNQLKLRQDALKLLEATAQNNTLEKRLKCFTDVYGDSFIIGYVTGGHFIADLDYATQNSSEQTSLKASLQLSYKNAFLSVSASDKFSKDSLSIVANTSCTVKITSLGFPTDAKLVVVDLPSLMETIGSFTSFDGSAKVSAVLFKFANHSAVRAALSHDDSLEFGTPSDLVMSIFRSQQYNLEYNLKIVKDLRGSPLRDDEKQMAELDDLEDKILTALTMFAGKTGVDMVLPKNKDEWKTFLTQYRISDEIDSQVLNLAKAAENKIFPTEVKYGDSVALLRGQYSFETAIGDSKDKAIIQPFNTSKFYWIIESVDLAQPLGQATGMPLKPGDKFALCHVGKDKTRKYLTSSKLVADIAGVDLKSASNLSADLSWKMVPDARGGNVSVLYGQSFGIQSGGVIPSSYLLGVEANGSLSVKVPPKDPATNVVSEGEVWRFGKGGDKVEDVMWEGPSIGESM
mmetsp:Transcript_34265/g.55448  ORF Transcript_34265/g.55448 Transcript_34265/m.55448 type:complete len:612 (-) Transcript_34265:83-1918(-)